MHVVVASGPGILALTGRDRRIIELALAKVGASRVGFADAVRALREAAEEVIPDGRIFLLGTCETGPIVGSIVSGVGIVEREHGIELVRAHRDTPSVPIGWFAR